MILTPQEMLDAKTAHVKSERAYFRDGIQLEKGATLSEKRIQQHQKLYQQYMDYFLNYVDCYLDLIKPTTSKFKFKQR